MLTQRYIRSSKIFIPEFIHESLDLKDFKNNFASTYTLFSLSNIVCITSYRAWVSHDIHGILGNVITHPCQNFDGDLTKAQLKLAYGPMIVSHIFLGVITNCDLSIILQVPTYSYMISYMNHRIIFHANSPACFRCDTTNIYREHIIFIRIYISYLTSEWMALVWPVILPGDVFSLPLIGNYFGNVAWNVPRSSIWDYLFPGIAHVYVMRCSKLTVSWMASTHL